MSKNKTQQSFERIDKLKLLFEHLSSENIISRLKNFDKTNEIAIAYKQILKDRGIDDFLSHSLHDQSSAE